jgi:predicted Zn finger-like uncharacterized protein
VSRMFTSCPACRSNLAVSVADLRVGQGYVRCGRCDKVFNSLLTLSEEMDDEEQSGLAATGTSSLPALEEADGSEQEDLAPPSHPASQMDVVESQPTGTYETIVLEGDGYLQTEEHVDEAEMDAHLQALARQMQEAPATEAPVAEVEIDADAAVGNKRRRQWPWWLAAAFLALALLTQLAHHNRQLLVAHPWFEQPVKAIYGWFGKSVEPGWDVRAYDLRQLSGDALIGASGSFTVHASIHNGAEFSQPPPLIRVVLRDRFGNVVSKVDIPASDYLLSAAPVRMAPDQRLDATLRLTDATQQAAGFDLDACLPGANGNVRCSNDP